MKKLPLLTAAAGLVTVFGVTTARADCPEGQDCVPDDTYTYGGMKCLSGYGGGIGACEERVQYDGSGHVVPDSKYCYFTSCDDPGGSWYYYNYYDWYYGDGWENPCYGWCPAE
jgi:hypothetical protein